MDLSNLIASEISYMRKLEILKGELEDSYNFSTYAAFKTVDRYSEGYITIENLKIFCRQHYSYPTERELLCVIRRIDTDGDAKISYSEF